MATNQTMTYKLVVDISNGVAQITNFNKALGQTSVQMQSTATHAHNLNNAFKPLHNTLLALAGGYIAQRIAKSFLDFGAKSELVMMRFEGILRSQKEAIALYDELQKFALKSPATLFELTEGAAVIGPILKGGRKEIMAWMPVIADLAAYMKVNFETAAEQVIKMFSSGAQAARLFRMHGVLAMLGFQAGVKYSAEETKLQLYRMWADSGSVFRGMADRMMQTWKGQSSNFMDYVGRFQRYFMGVGEAMGGEKGLLGTMTGYLKKINDEFQRMDERGELKKRAKNLADIFIHLADVLGKIAFWIIDHPDFIKGIINIVLWGGAIFKVAQFATGIVNMGRAWSAAYKIFARAKIGEAIILAFAPVASALLPILGLLVALSGAIATIWSIAKYISAEKTLSTSSDLWKSVEERKRELEKDPRWAKAIDEERKAKGMREYNLNAAAAAYETYDPTKDVERKSEEYFLMAFQALAGKKKAILEKSIQDEIEATEKKFEQTSERYKNQYRKEYDYTADFEKAKIEIRQRLTDEWNKKESAEEDSRLAKAHAKYEKYIKSLEDELKAFEDKSQEGEKAYLQKIEDIRTGRQMYAKYKMSLATPYGEARGTNEQYLKRKTMEDEVANYEVYNADDLAKMLKGLQDYGMIRSQAELAIDTYIWNEKRRLQEDYYADEADLREKAEQRERDASMDAWQRTLRRTAKAFGDMGDLYAKWGEMGAVGKRKAFQMTQAFGIAEALMNTALGVTEVLQEDIPTLAKIPLIGLVTAIGSSQMAMIASQKMPSYDQGGVSRKAGTYWSGVPEAHIPLQGGAVPVRFMGSGAGGGGGVGGVNIILQNPTFQDIETQRQTMTMIAKMVTEQLAPTAVVRDFHNDGQMRRIISG